MYCQFETLRMNSKLRCINIPRAMIGILQGLYQIKIQRINSRYSVSGLAIREKRKVLNKDGAPVYPSLLRVYHTADPLYQSKYNILLKTAPKYRKESCSLSKKNGRYQPVSLSCFPFRLARNESTEKRFPQFEKSK